MVTTSTQQDGASSSSPTNPPSRPEQQPSVTDNSNQMTQSPSDDAVTEAASPLIHPAPLPEEYPLANSNPNWKRPPPKLMIKIYDDPVGAVVSWHTLLTPNHEEIAKYQLYFYQEGTLPPSTELWKKLGDIDPLVLPMACTLSRFFAGYTYHFAIRAVDIHGRCGKFSESLGMYMEEDKIADELRIKEEPASSGDEEEEAEPIDDSNCEEMESVQGKDEEEGLVSEGNGSEKVAELDSVTPVKEVEKMVECVKESEMDVGQGKEQDMEVAAQGKEQDKETVQAIEQDTEMVQVKEEKDSSSCSC